ncbi:MAG: amino acid racemase [Ruthenibacterium sp.]
MADTMHPAVKQPPKVLGILGGLGPMATVYFYEMLTKHTKAKCDQDHIDVIINSRATTPDRTAYILGQSSENPFDIMAADAARLVTFGADVIAIPCNTAHYFYDRLNDSIAIPILNMVEETVLCAKARCSKVGILATSGTVQTGTYQRMCETHALACAVPDEAGQAAVMHLIYDCIKQGRPADMARFFAVADGLRAQGCERIILGCTELSLIKRDEKLDEFYLDSMEVLAKNAIETFGKTPVGF